MKLNPFHLGLVVLGLIVTTSTVTSAPARADLEHFTTKYCPKCHAADVKKGTPDLPALKWDLDYPNAFSKWVAVLDRVPAGKMPPAKKARPAANDLKSFTNNLANSLLEND